MAEKSLVQCVTEAASEDLRRKSENFAFDRLKTIVGIVVGNTVLQAAFGPIGFSLPVADVVMWGARMAYEGYRDWRKDQQADRPIGLSYQVETTSTGMVAARELKGTATATNPLRQPSQVEFRVGQLASPSSRSQVPASRQSLDAVQVFRNLAESNLGGRCPACKRTISTFGTLEMGHAPLCSRNPYSSNVQNLVDRLSNPTGRSLPSSATACVLCGRDVLGSGLNAIGHSPNCPLNPDNLVPPLFRPILAQNEAWARTCRVCGQTMQPKKCAWCAGRPPSVLPCRFCHGRGWTWECPNFPHRF